MIYEGDALREIRFPIGGIGSGSVCIAGNGRFCDWEIFNRPDKGSINGYSHIAVCLKVGGKLYTRVLCGDFDGSFMGQYSKALWTGYGFGPEAKTMCGFPHFEKVTFDGRFPIARLTFEDKDFPGRVVLTAFNPLIPTDAENSSIPAAFFEISYENDGREDAEFMAALSVCNPFEEGINVSDGERSVMLRNSKCLDAPDSIGYGDITIATDCPQSGTQEYWYRGKWQDGVVMYWNDLSRGMLPPRHYDTPSKNDTATVYGRVGVSSGKTDCVRFVMSWSIPNCNAYWKPLIDGQGREVTWKNYYATRYASSSDSAAYALANFSSLLERTERYVDAMFSQSLDPAVIDAAASTLSVLKSPTVFRLENGEFYGWEGVNEQVGSCEGTCQHVWGYAYALCFLFPELERSIHELEVKYCMREDGGTVFRIKLPLGREKGNFRPCVDGQMGTIIKFYRDWRISGDTAWLRRHWSAIKKMIAFAWSEENADCWDRDMDGVLEGRQHHTLDMELFGPHAWLEGYYLAALRACAEMAHELSDSDETLYASLFEKGYKWTSENLFNGEYFIQKLDINDKSQIDKYEGVDDYWNEESGEIKYQIAEGCEIDQLCGQWHATINSLGYVFDKGQIHTALGSLFANNHKSSMRSFTNPWRVFALNDEAATVICDYPEGVKKPTIPIPYCEESMNGFEYQLGGMLVSEGFVEEGLRVVRGVRDRYDGKKRNPYNEFECGSNYARSMASFALLPIFSGFCFDMPHGCIGFDPIQKTESFSFLWSLDCGYGVFERRDNLLSLSVTEGSLPISRLKLPFIDGISALFIDGHPTSFEFRDGELAFKHTDIANKLEILL